MKGLEEVLQKHGVDFSSVAKVTVERPKERLQEVVEKKKGGKEAVEETVQELNEIVSKVNDMGTASMPSKSHSGDHDEKVGCNDMKNITI